jgi:hypothetical protein
MAMPAALHWRSGHDPCTRPAVVIPSAHHKSAMHMYTVQCSAVQRSTRPYTARFSSALCTAPALLSAVGRSRSQPWRSLRSAISLTAHTSHLIGVNSSRVSLLFQLVTCPCRVCHDNNSWADAGVIDLSCLRAAQPLAWLLSAFPHWLASHSHFASQPQLPATQLHHHHHYHHHHPTSLPPALPPNPPPAPHPPPHPRDSFIPQPMRSPAVLAIFCPCGP